MPVKEILNKIRAEHAVPVTIKQGILRVLSVFALGILLGFVSKYSDTIPSNGLTGIAWGAVKDISTRPGVWVLLAAVIAAWSNNPRIGAIKVFAFFAGMLPAYYIYSAKLFGFFPAHYFLRWGIIALLSPLAAYVVWFGRGNGWIAALCAALPIGLLAAQGYSFLYTFALAPGFDFLAAIALFLILPKSKNQYLKILPLTLLIVFLLRSFSVINYIMALAFRTGRGK